MKATLLIVKVLFIGSYVALPGNASEYGRVTLGFEDLGPGQQNVPTTYAGLTWDPRWDYYSYLQWPLDPCSSGPARIIYGSWIDFGEDVTFLGSWVGTFAWGGDKYWLGYNDGILVYESPHLTADYIQYGWINVYWTNVDYVELIGSSGSYAIDDISYVPGLVIKAELKIVPKVLNLRDKGKWITCSIWIPQDYRVSEIDCLSIVLGQKIKPEWISSDEEEHVVMARFVRSEVVEWISECEHLGEVEVTVRGELLDGTRFGGKDIIKVIE